MSARLIKGEAFAARHLPYLPPAAGAAGVPPPGRQFQQHPAPPPSPAPAPAHAHGGGQEARPEEVIAEAHAEAERILAAAAAQADTIEQEASARGLAQGRAAADDELARAVEPLRERLAASLGEVCSLRGLVAERAERDLVRLALEIAKKVVQREVTVDGEVVLALARVALSRVSQQADATVRLHPEDFAYVSVHRERFGWATSVVLVEDRSVGRGGCIVETEMGAVDARIEQQFEELERSFLGF